MNTRTVSLIAAAGLMAAATAMSVGKHGDARPRKSILTSSAKEARKKRNKAAKKARQRNR